MWSSGRIITRALPSLKKCFKESLKLTENSFNRCKCARTISYSRPCWEKRYSDMHEWVEVNGKIATVGISQYAQEALGDVVYAQLPDIGAKIEQKEECGALESVKAASEIYSPVSGTVTEKNTAVEDTPALVNQSCYDKGWLFRVEMSKEEEVKELMNEEQYKEFLKANQH